MTEPQPRLESPPGLPGPDKWGTEPQFHSVSFFNSRIRTRFIDRVRASGKTWEEAVFDPDLAITRADVEAIEAELLATGYRYTPSAEISVTENPEKYAAPAPSDAATVVGTADDPSRPLAGSGQNVLRTEENTVGVVRFVSSTARVLEMLTQGVPDETIAVIDDSGGTLTAPIIGSFKGILCLGGTIRSHLGILAREYGIPTLMGCQLQGLREGDRVELESTASPPAATSEDFDESTRAQVWRLGAES